MGLKYEKKLLETLAAQTILYNNVQKSTFKRLKELEEKKTDPEETSSRFNKNDKHLNTK